MNRVTDYKKLAEDITSWIRDYATTNNIKSLVVGVSGGIDSAVVSTLCARTGLHTYCCRISIGSNLDHLNTARDHVEWLWAMGYRNVTDEKSDMTKAFDMFTWSRLSSGIHTNHDHVMANTKSRMRMMALYELAGQEQGIVVGTGNKVEDFGVGFFTKWGDGGSDLNPIADLYKTEVRELGRYLGVSEEIINAHPCDGLWADCRTDEQVLGATYEELEWAMEYDNLEWNSFECIEPFKKYNGDAYVQRQFEVRAIYDKLHKQNQHKMLPIPIYKLPL